MTDETSTTDAAARDEAVQAVVNRVSAWQHGATDGTVLKEVRNGLQEAEVQLDAGTIQRLANAIEADDGPVNAAELLA